MTGKITKTINVSCDVTGCASRSEPVNFSVPFGRAELFDVNRLSLKALSGSAKALQAKPLSYWSDGSIKWLNCDIFSDLMNGSEQLSLSTGATERDELESHLTIHREGSRLIVDTGKIQYFIDSTVLRPFIEVRKSDGEKIQDRCELILRCKDNRIWIPVIDKLEIMADGPVRAAVVLSGEFRNSKKVLANFTSMLTFYSNDSRAQFEITLHNPAAAKHPNNLWDLGDEGSILLRDFSLVVHCQDAIAAGSQVSTVAGSSCKAIQFEKHWGLSQESSGGRNWDSPVHRNRHGKVPLHFKGWKESVDGATVDSGLRSQPLCFLGNECIGFSVQVDKFWQRFPKSLYLDRKKLIVGLLPTDFNDLHELQGGEQCTEKIRFDFSGNCANSRWGSAVGICNFEDYQGSDVLTPHLYAPTNSGYRKLLDNVFDEKGGFFAKREQLDEYGWRNFGDIYADHETAFHHGTDIFVSHYNNQYDLLASFYREYLITKDVRWQTLARDLASHVADIDINQTTCDRDEYNLGPFWHTDHYLDAGLSTHRMSSKEHLEHKPASKCGGGPASEMCYLSGLSLHYLLTGDERFRRLVLQLADWNWQSLNGIKTIGAATLRLIKNVKRWGNGRKRNIVWSRYPFTRGTGNCLNSNLEALELTNDQRYLDRACQLIRGTVHPDDEPQKRNLLDAEVNWSYTVFLSMLGRFLQIKRNRQEDDENYLYARDSLLTYARWMLEHEYPYLDRPEILEFPNDTWVAQDLRKAVILFYASSYVVGEERIRFLERARFFSSHTTNTLLDSKTNHYSRIQSLILQNGWVEDALDLDVPNIYESLEYKHYKSNNLARLTWLSLLRLTLSDFWSSIRMTSIKREWDWLAFRMFADKTITRVQDKGD